jgi:putative ABC transport system permease protein
MAFIQVKEGRSPEEVLAKLNQHFPELSATRSGNLIGQIRLIKVVETSAWAISIISFIACCIIVMNTFMMAVAERTKEIGILMAVGWSRWMVAKNIVFEAIGICLLGGVLGNLMGFVQLWVFSQINPEGLGWWVSLSGSVDILAKSIGLSLLLGIIGSLYPALRASKLLPAEALRYE